MSMQYSLSKVVLWWITIQALFVASFSGSVVELTIDSFFGFIKAERLALVRFYAPWCGHCKATANDYERAATRLKGLGIESTMAQIDGSLPVVEELIASENVDGYPSYFLYKNGHRVGEYHGNRTESDIVEYMKRKSVPAAKRVSSELELIPFISALDRTDQIYQGILGVAVGLYPGDENLDSLEAQLFENIADKYDYSKFFVSTSPSLIADFKVTEPSIIVFSADTRDIYHTIKFSEKTTEEQIIDELLLLSMPLSVPLNSQLMPLLSSLPVVHALVFYDVNGDDENFVDAVTSVIPTFKGKIMMVEVSSDDYHILHQFGIESTSDLPQLILMDPSSERVGRKFSFTDFLRHFHQNQMNEGEEYELIDHNTLLARFANVRYSMWLRPIAKSEDNDRLFYNSTLIEQFFRLFFADESVQSLNSQDMNEIAKLNVLTGSANIENLASSQFETRIMHDANTDSFVYFHAPWCIHCKAMEAMMVELADHYRHDSSIYFFRIDAQKNEIAHSQVKLVGLPSMYLFPAENKMQPLFFDGERSLQGFVDFIDQNRHSKPSQVITEQEMSLNGQ